MKAFLALSTFITAATVVCAQFVSIAVPSPGATIAPGSNLLVEIDRSNTNSEVHEVATAIALSPGGPQACLAGTTASSVLFVGPYDPQLDPGTGHKPPNQNFTVLVPESAPLGTAQLSVTRFFALGAVRGPSYEYKSITVTVG
ncbi:hypothetical protein HGRIS_012638 [Hohenbuehelia grisea]|uniref:Secreted protein n=1 Tax=Hohenbuehelia grisea TaxID=104357 RepID=A0ABR3ISW9_9AGAR